jgi:hypothetical protein
MSILPESWVGSSAPRAQVVGLIRRAEGFIIMSSFTTIVKMCYVPYLDVTELTLLGFITIAACKEVENDAAAQVREIFY